MVLTSISLINKYSKENYPQKQKYERAINNIVDPMDNQLKEQYDESGNILNDGSGTLVYVYADNSLQNNNYTQLSHNIMFMISVFLLFVEIFITIYLITTLCNCYKGMERLLHIILLILFPIPYLFFFLFLGNDCVKKTLGKNISGNNKNFSFL